MQVLSTADVWTELTFTIAAPTFDNPDLYESIAIIPDWDDANQVNRTTDETYYIDDIELVADGGGGGGGGGSTITSYCSTSQLHFGGDPASEILVTFENVNSTTMRMEMVSADANAIDVVDLAPGAWSVVPGFQVVPNDDDMDGTWVAELLFPEGTTEIDIYFLWSKVDFAGNWQSHDVGAGERATIEFSNTCP